MIKLDKEIQDDLNNLFSLIKKQADKQLKEALGDNAPEVDGIIFFEGADPHLTLNYAQPCDVYKDDQLKKLGIDADENFLAHIPIDWER